MISEYCINPRNFIVSEDGLLAVIELVWSRLSWVESRLLATCTAPGTKVHRG